MIIYLKGIRAIKVTNDPNNKITVIELNDIKESMESLVKKL